MFDGLFEGLAWVLVFFYDLTHSYGFSIILLTITVMAVVTPLTLKGTKSMMAMQRLQPEMRRIQQEFKQDRQKLNEEMLRFYKENDINPMGSCLPLLIQMPIFLVLFQVVKGITNMGPNGFEPSHLKETTELYQSLVGQTTMPFLGIDLHRTPLAVLREDGFVSALPFIVLIALWVSTSYLQQRQVSGRNPEAMNPQQRMMMRIIPIFSLTAIWFPAALSLYWVTSNLCRVATQGYISQRYYNLGWLGFGKKKDENGTATIDVKAKPAKPSTDGQKKSGAGGSNAKAAKPASGRVTPAKGKSSAHRPGTAPGRRSSSPRAGGDRPRRRVPNGPAESSGQPAEAPESTRKKWRR